MGFREQVNAKAKKQLITKGNEVVVHPRIPTPSVSLNLELGGGVPLGRITGFVGPYSSGKTALALMTTAEYMKRWPEKEVLWVDAEGVFDPVWAKILGVDIDRLNIMRPEYGEQAYDVLLAAFDANVGLGIIDSIAALAPKAILEKDMDEVTVAALARLNQKFMIKLKKYEDKKDTVPPTLIYLNQFYKNSGGYGPQLIEKGGEALNYYPSVKIHLKAGDLYDGKKTYTKVQADDEGVEVKAQVIQFYIEKNKTAPPKRRGHFWFYFDTLDRNRRKGTVDTLEEILRIAQKYDIVTQRVSDSGKKTAMFDVVNKETGELRSFKGAPALAAWVRADDKVREWIIESVQKKIVEDMTGGVQEETEETISEEELPQLRVVRDDEAEGNESSQAV